MKKKDKGRRSPVRPTGVLTSNEAAELGFEETQWEYAELGEAQEQVERLQQEADRHEAKQDYVVVNIKGGATAGVAQVTKPFVIYARGNNE